MKVIQLIGFWCAFLVCGCSALHKTVNISELHQSFLDLSKYHFDYVDQSGILPKVFIAYPDSQEKVVLFDGESKKVYDYYFLCVQNGGTNRILGKVGPGIVTDTSGKILKDLTQRKKENAKIVGISESFLDNPFLPTLILKDDSGTWEADAFVSLDIDFPGSTLILQKERN